MRIGRGDNGFRAISLCDSGVCRGSQVSASWQAAEAHRQALPGAEVQAARLREAEAVGRRAAEGRHAAETEARLGSDNPQRRHTTHTD